jgi:hypothetical protein
LHNRALIISSFAEHRAESLFGKRRRTYFRPMKTRAMNDVENRLAKLEQRRQRLDARLTGMRARASMADAKRENRRRLVAGGVVLSALDSRDDVWSLVARVFLDKALKHPDERALFQLDL